MSIKRSVVPAVGLGLALTIALTWFLGNGTLLGVRATGFTVDVTYDENDGSCSDGDCSLRDAIIIANGNGEADLITLGAGTHALSLIGTGEDGSAVGDLDITEPLTITGLGPDATIIDASGVISDRVFDIQASASTVVISGVAILNGDYAGWGGGIDAYEMDLTLINTLIAGNTAGYGGGVATNRGTVRLVDGRIVSNTADRGGGLFVYGIGAVFTQTGDSIIAYNYGTGTGGGGIYVSEASAALVGGQIVGNVAANNGGGVNVSTGGLTLIGGQIIGNSAGNGGGGVSVEGNSTLFSQTGLSVIAHNSAGYGGAVYARDARVTFDGADILSNAADDSGGGFQVEGGSVALVSARVASNTAGTYGGGVYASAARLILDGGEFVHNAAGRRGGGLYVGHADSVFTQTGDSLIAHNVVSDTGRDGNGGGLYLGGGPAVLEGGWIVGNVAPERGGGLYVANGRPMISRGRILSNTAMSGGGIYNNGGVVALVNTTLSGNSATGSYGGLRNNTGTSVLTFTTVASNTARRDGGGLAKALGTVLLHNTLVAHNLPLNCSGTIASAGHNLDSGSSCGLSALGDITDTAPLIGLLNADGVHPLLDRSPAVDAGLCLHDVTTDQRGVPRPQRAGCDIGAYEFTLYKTYLPSVMRNW